MTMGIRMGSLSTSNTYIGENGDAYCIRSLDLVESAPLRGLMNPCG